MYPLRVDAPTYKPAWWLPGPHLPTLWGKVARRTMGVPSRRTRLELPDGDFLDVYSTDAPRDRPRVLILHGLEGSVRSHYVQGVFGEARRRGWGATLLAFRSCGPELNRLPRSYHSGETGDLSFVLEYLLKEHPSSAVGLVGFSLGGNVLLKWLGERGADLPPRVVAAAAVSVPFDLDRSCAHLSQGFARVYQRFLVRQLLEKGQRKRALFGRSFSRHSLRGIRSLRAFDDAVTAPLHGFRDAADYYAQSSSIESLRAIVLPTLLLNAVDDPFLPSAVLDDVRVRAARNRAIELEFVPRGGHVGFVSGSAPWRARYYAEWRALHFLADRIDPREYIDSRRGRVAPRVV